MEIRNLKLPLTNEERMSLKCGEIISVSGKVFTARDAAHKRLIDALNNGLKLPINIENAAIYYCGPTPTKEGEIIGSCGPTTSSRMDSFTPALLERGLKVMIGKGKRSDLVNLEIKKHSAIYLAAIGGAGALIKNTVTKLTPVCYEDLGCEAINEIEFKSLELLVATDAYGNSALK